MTIPGVGPLTALVFKTFVDRPERFRHSKAVGAAVGLTPRKYASGEVDYDGHITKCGDTFLRSHLFEAAKVLMGRAGKPNDLKAWGLRLAKRSSKKKACVAVARRLAVIMHAMWRDGTVFQIEQKKLPQQRPDLRHPVKNRNKESDILRRKAWPSGRTGRDRGENGSECAKHTSTDYCDHAPDRSPPSSNEQSLVAAPETGTLCWRRPRKEA